ncbi:MAG: HAD-IIIC family phosphatase [Clostridia bacterium]|nr:HAD-IIIC family phosphatase [Clostridia bacterium]
MEKIKIALISNITFEPYLRGALNDEFAGGVQLDHIPYEEYKGRAEELALYDYAVICLSFEALYPDIGDSSAVVADAVSRCRELLGFVRQATSAKILWLGFEDYCYSYECLFGNVAPLGGLIDSINLSLAELLGDGDVLIDLKRLIATVGLRASYSSKGKYRWNSPYSKELMQALAREIGKQHRIRVGQTKKCLVLDCDNLLWGGIVSEDGIEGIRLDGGGLGRQYLDFQRFVLTMYRHGVILAVCSKNDEADVLRVFREHSAMLLREDNIACFAVNWQSKAENIKTIADKLNIGLDSMVFVDDSEFEVGSVRELLPEVKAILYDRETVYSELSCFNLKADVDPEGVKKRNETYRTNAARDELLARSTTYEEYLKTLEIKVDIHAARADELARIAELSQRANKLTNGTRYASDRLKALPDGYELYSVCVSDRFSDLGLVGAVGISGGVIDLFVLSCRALGRDVENEMLEFLKGRALLDYKFVSTSKNEDVSTLLKSVTERK